MDVQKTGTFISELRKEKNLTQKQLAEILYVSDKAVSRWETGKGFPELSIMEDLAGALDVSVAEIMKGERIDHDVSSRELIDLTDDSLLMFRNIFRQQRIRLFLSGFLFGLIVLIIAVTHLNSPITFDDHSKVVSIETLNDGRIVAVLDEEVAGYDVETISEEKSVFVSCYSTKWYEMFGKKKEKIIALGNRGDIDSIYYYPGEDGDQLIYSSGNPPGYGVMTLPRLVYNYWILIGIFFSIVSVSLYLIFRKKYYSRLLFRITSFFVSFTLSLFIVLAGKMDKIYNASYYLSGILLLTICLTFLISSIGIYRSEKRKQ